MNTQPSIVDLVAGYSAYATAEELNAHADAPATTAICATVTGISETSVDTSTSVSGLN